MNIHQAVGQGNLECVQELLTSNPELINAQDWERYTHLHRAAGMGHTELALLLLNHGANVNAQDWCQLTPLHVAAHRGKTEVASLLLHHGANVNPLDCCQYTPLHKAARYGNTKVASLLLEHEADVNAPDYCQRTPLHCANGNREVMQLLKDWTYYYQQLRNNQLVAFCMAQHKRLGSDSPANVLPNEMFYHIAQFVISGFPNNTIEQIHEIAEQKRKQKLQQKNGERNIARFILGSGGVALAAASCAVIIYRLFGR
jgi:ankyrin repeat protein